MDIIITVLFSAQIVAISFFIHTLIRLRRADKKRQKMARKQQILAQKFQEALQVSIKETKTLRDQIIAARRG